MSRDRVPTSDESRIVRVWRAPEEVRLRRAADWLVDRIPELWRLEAHRSEFGHYSLPVHRHTVTTLPQPQRGYYDETVAALAGAFGEAELPHLVPYLYFYPRQGLLPEPPAGATPAWWATRQLGLHTCRIWLADKRPALGIELAIGRLRFLVQGGLANFESERSDHGFDPPQAKDCEELLLHWWDASPVQAAVAELLDGNWDRPLEFPAAIQEAWTSSRREQTLEYYKGKGTYAYFGLYGIFWRGLLDLAQRGALDLARLQDLGRRSPSCVPVHVAARDHCHRAPFDPAEAAAAPLIRDYVAGLARDIDANHWQVEHYWNDKLEGWRFVIAACEHVERKKPQSLEALGYHFSTAIRWLADAHPRPEEDPAAALAELRRFSPETLRLLLPWARATGSVLLEALGWSDAAPLLRAIHEEAARRHEAPYGERTDAPNSIDAASGVVDRLRIDAALRVAGPELARTLIEALRAGKAGFDNTLTLVEAVAGWNRARIEKDLDRLVQVSLKAYGLLPLQNGEAEVLERYRRLRRAARECRKFGAEREANTRAATLAGLANLAQTAGYGDLEQFEWAIEARIQESSTQSLRIAEYDVALEFSELAPRITVRRAGRELKAPPAAVRNAEAYKELRVSADELKAQVSRFRRALEEAMLEGRPFAPAGLDSARRLASLSTLFARLVLIQPDGASGLLDEGGLIDLEGRLLSHREGTRIAHPLDLSDADLRAWQQHLVGRGLRQPFKQAFREVYVATDAERGADETRRFAGHELEGGVLRRLLGRRGWRVTPGDVPEPFRPFKAADLRARFDFPTARHYIGEDSEPLVSGAIWFTRDVEFGPRIRLGEVPDRILSEVFRDADLIVAAARTGDDVHSDEAYARRAETVQALATMLGVPGVEREGRHVVVSGKLARYRVHLGSATVLVDPANVVCILPARQPSAKDALWLPFAEEDERLAEAVSKVLLLAADDRVEDPALLAQIRAAAGPR